MTNSLEKGLFQEIVITDYEQAMAGFLFLTQKIKTVVQEKLAIGNNNYEILTKVKKNKNMLLR
ncbi:hypothetical protein C6B38_01350 [Spiroplasma sp. ChiS]|uniref:hypothetical protein n=1 Tax=Spiroplasma sp. ChiS TaxID=2099885 RepID=UPI000CF86567|nr:hypothetical protein [Spiroplasma sp. ChiS]PQP79398.1 hypothetical protein C6B38_01350 [Spiroplasma sp. ChiS]